MMFGPIKATEDFCAEGWSMKLPIAVFIGAGLLVVLSTSLVRIISNWGNFILDVLGSLYATRGELSQCPFAANAHC